MHGTMNELSRKLIDAGYIPEEHKLEFVTEEHGGCKRVYSEFDWSGSWKQFEYSPKFLRHMVFEAPCGLLMDGIDSYSYMGFMGIDWCPENDNSTHACPHKKDGCPLNHEYLRSAFGHKRNILQCAFHFSNKAYDYENSTEKAWADYHKIQECKRKEFYSRLKWNPEARFCECINWDDEKQNWTARYDPWSCVHGCWNDVCVLTGRRLDEKKGNVFYDAKVIQVCHDGSIWDGESQISIIKGKKMFKSPKPIAICEAYAKLCKDFIYDREKNKFHQLLFFHKDASVEVLNVRVEFRESRDLLQDLRDVREGIKITHASDEIKLSAEAKRERRKKYQEAKRARSEKRRVYKWKRLLKDDEYFAKETKENGWTQPELMRQFFERELKKRGIVVEQKPAVEQLSLF